MVNILIYINKCGTFVVTYTFLAIVTPLMMIDEMRDVTGCPTPFHNMVQTGTGPVMVNVISERKRN